MASKGIKVLKFGGTSMGSADSMRKVVAIVRSASIASKKEPRAAAVVVSAMSGVTDQLIMVAKYAAKKNDSYEKVIAKIEARHLQTIQSLVGAENQQAARADITRMTRHLTGAAKGVLLVGSLSPQALDYIVSYGERLSARMLVHILNDKDVACEYLNARRIITTDDSFGKAEVDFSISNKTIRAYFKKHTKLQIVTGFIGATRTKKTTTLGRGGSDYSAAILGAALRARVIEIWTDVSGVYTADPRLERSARVVPELTFEEAGELAYFGAKVLHPKTILPAMRERIPVRVLNTFKPSERGTTIVADEGERKGKSRTVDALTFKRPVIVIHVHSPEFFDANGLMASIFNIFQTYRTSIDVIATSVAGISLTIDDDTHLREITKALKKFGSVRVERHKAILCAVGGKVDAAGVAGRMFTVLGKHNVAVEMISQASGGVSITFVVDEDDAKKALKILHKEYIRGRV